jgi:hypothetical protein
LLDIGKPSQHSERGVHDVESLLGIQVLRKLVQVRPDEGCFGLEADLGDEPLGLFDPPLREVHARDRRPQPRPRQRLESEVALEM